ncbi:hypothetical protein BHM03_00058176 [Ensete ventricosum]|nr:hypothetical protein BHM03_00058176 [Ensete ventricosum]
MALRGALLLSTPGVSFDGAANREYDHLSKRRDPQTNMSRQEVVKVAAGIIVVTDSPWSNTAAVESGDNFLICEGLQVCFRP